MLADPYFFLTVWFQNISIPPCPPKMINGNSQGEEGLIVGNFRGVEGVHLKNFYRM